MPDANIEQTIYKLELDGSDYINSIDKLTSSTNKLSTSQEEANKTLADNKKRLAEQSEYLQKAKKDLDSYTGTNQKFKEQIQKDYQSAQAQNKTLVENVNQSKIAYDKANAAAKSFAETAARAQNLQASTTSGKIQTSVIPTAVPQQITSQIAGILNVPEFVDQSVVIQKTKAEFDNLRTTITLADARMQQLNKTDAEFQALAPIVAKGKDALLAYDQAAKLAGNSTLRLRTQILQGRDSLAKLEQAGKQNTQEFIDQRNHLAALNKEYRIAESEVNVLASQTRVVDFGKAAVEGAISSFQVYTSLSILAGGASEELQKKTLKLFAAMQLITALEQLATSVKKGSTLATNLDSVATATYTAVVGASTGALLSFKAALLGTGIGAAIVLIGLLVEKWNEVKKAEEEAKLEEKSLLDIRNKSAESYTEEVTHLKLLEGEYENLNTSTKRRKEIQDELQKSYPNYFKDLDKEADKQKYIAEQIGKVNKALILQAEIQGAQSLLADKFKDLLKAEFDPKSTVTFLDKVAASMNHLTDAAAKADLAKVTAVHINNAEYEYNQFADFIQNFINNANAQIDLLGGDPHAKPSTEKVIKQVQDDFEARKAALLEELAKLAESQFQSEKTIAAEYAIKLKKAIIDINKDKTTTPAEKKILIDLAVKLNTGQYKKAIDDFNKKVKEAQDKLNEELYALQTKANEDSLSLIQDDFDKRKKLIEFNQSNELELQRRDTVNRLKGLDNTKFLLSEEEYQNAKASIVAIGEQKVNNIIVKYNQERQKLSFDIFEHLGEQLKKSLEDENLDISQNSLLEINKQNDLLAANKITFEQYQKEITRISQEESDKRTQHEIDNLRKEINLNSIKIDQNNNKLSEDEKTKLLDQIREDEKKILDLQKTQGVQTNDPNGPGKKPDTIAAYAQAIGQLADSVIQFWQASNDAESKALDRSIALQQTRVDAAQKIAERGNANYLKAERDRLTQLNLARENAARKQLGINAALQASQILVGIAGAIADIATPGIGVAKTITDIAVIIGAIATGYGIVKTLSANQPTFFEGDPYVSRGTNPAGRDTIPAMINEGEAITSAEKNKAYHPAILAIHNGTIPAEHMNNFVKNYHQIKPVPQLNTARIKEVAELHIGENGRMAVLLNEQNKKLDENNGLQRLTLRAMKNMAVSATIDKNGVAISVNEYIAKMEIDKKT